MKRKWISLFLASAMMVNIVACTSDKNDRDDDENETEVEETDETTYETSDISSEYPEYIGLAQIHAGVEAPDYSAVYNQPLYQLEADYVFEFEAEDSAGYIAYDAFSVYVEANYNVSQVDYCECSYEDGIISVAPRSTLHITEDGSSSIDDGTWGSLNKLYLIQNIDLTTGEELETRIITPFSVVHDLDAPVLSQGVTEDNLYQLTWTEVPGATEYRVYRNLSDLSYELEATTTSLSATVEEFASRIADEEFMDLFEGDLAEAGFNVESGTSNQFYMNTCLADSYVVVAFNGSQQSGISNECVVGEISNRLPYCVEGNICEEVNSVLDFPTHVNVVMLDGSIVSMLIDYTDAGAARLDNNPNAIALYPHVLNTMFNSFQIILTGFPYEEFLAAANEIHNRQSNIDRTGGLIEPTIVIPEAPTNGEEEDLTDLINSQFGAIAAGSFDAGLRPGSGRRPSGGSNSTPTPTPASTSTSTSTGGLGLNRRNHGQTPQGDSTSDLYAAAVTEVENRLALIDGIEDVLYSNSELEEWIAKCLVTNLELIPIPSAVFPEVSNSSYLNSVLMEAYRQNPTSGMITNCNYNYSYEAFVVSYAEDWNTRMSKTQEELAAASRIANTITGTGAEAVYQINDYLCANASYDFDSTSDNVTPGTYPEAYVDAHTPYGIICNNYGVCESYSEAFALIARTLGMEAIMETGTLDGGPHEWSKVKINGNWYVVDVTNNDNDYVSNGILCISDSVARSLIIANPNNSYIGSFSATDDSLDYYSYIGRLATTNAAASEILADQLSEGSTIAVCRIPSSFNRSTQASICRTACQNATSINGNDPYMINFANILCIMTER
ncbi:MAG: transglutaminase-like domain-containing protein [Saccharofermentans sp.]|nr:transglutaminase-like domain-containing protein [Saccharofermentans sp.]